MALSEAKKAADKRYGAKLDQIMVRPYKHEGAAIRIAAAERGQSVQSYILQAVRDRMSRERAEWEAVEAAKAVKDLRNVKTPPQRPEEPLEFSEPMEKRFPLERLGTEVLKLPPEASGAEILRLEQALSGIDVMMMFCNMTQAERVEWKRRRDGAVSSLRDQGPEDGPYASKLSDNVLPF